MKKKYFSILVVAIVATVASFNIYSSQKESPMSDLALANVEALAGCESSTGDTGYRKYYAENGCHCLYCPEPKDTSCNCLSD